MGASLRLVTPPPPHAEVRSLTIEGKVLVVEADYFALTSRIDQNVIFWDTNAAAEETRIPDDVTRLWISRYTDASVRKRLQFQARARRIIIWSCSLPELRKRLLPFWKDPNNRSLVNPADPDELPGMRQPEVFLFPTDESNVDTKAISTSSVDEIGGGSSIASMEEVEEEQENEIFLFKQAQAEEKDRQKRLARIKKAWERLKRQADKTAKAKVMKSQPKPEAKTEPKPQAATPQKPATALKINAKALANLPDLDRQIFSRAHGLGTSLMAPADIAIEFALPLKNVERILARVQSKLTSR